MAKTKKTRKPTIESQIRQIKGWTKEQYKKEYTTFAARVRNYNRAAGTHLSAAKQFLNVTKFGDNLSTLEQALLKTSATRAHRKGELVTGSLDIAKEVAYDRWGGFLNKSTYGQKLADQLEGRTKLTNDQLNTIKQEFIDRNPDTADREYQRFLKASGTVMTPEAFNILLSAKARQIKLNRRTNPAVSYD